MDVDRLVRECHVLYEHMRLAGYTDNYIRTIKRGVRFVVEGAPRWSGYDDALEDCEALAEGKGERERRKVAVRMIADFDREGILPRSGERRARARKNSVDRLGEGFRAVIDAAGSYAQGRKSPRTIRNEACNAAAFFLRLEERGLSRPQDVDERAVLDIVCGRPDGRAMGAASVRRVRSVLGDASHAMPECAKMLALVPRVKGWRRAVPCLTAEERGRIRDVLDSEDGPLSARDRAICCLFFYMGLRGSDVASLELGDIDWEAERISLVQQKTGVPLELPLTAAVGNALFDYVTAERGPSDDPHVFLSRSYPFGGISAGTACAVSAALYDAAAVRVGTGERRGAHLLRHNLATSMVESGVPRAVVSATLGHSSWSSTERYVSADVARLRECALDIGKFPVREGALRRER